MAWESAGLRIRRENQRGEEIFRLNGNRVRVNFETDESGNADVNFPNGFSRNNASVSITIFNGNIYTQIFPNAIYTSQVNIVSEYANSNGWVDFIK